MLSDANHGVLATEGPTVPASKLLLNGHLTSSRIGRLVTGMAFALVWLSVTGSGSAAAECPPAAVPSVTVDAPLPEPRLINTHDRDRIAAIRGSGGAVASVLPTRLDGLTSTRFITRYQIGIEQTSRRPDCFRINDLDIDIEVEKLDVYIVRELAPASCRYRVTLEHEMQHVAVMRSGLTELRDSLHAALTTERFSRPIPADSIDEAFRELGDAAAETIDELRLEAVARMEQRNRELDTPASYAALNARCP